MADSLLLELADFEHLVHTGIYSEETGQPQPLRFTVQADGSVTGINTLPKALAKRI